MIVHAFEYSASIISISFGPLLNTPKSTGIAIAAFGTSISLTNNAPVPRQRQYLFVGLVNRT
jgi:hypothetical protein